MMMMLMMGNFSGLLKTNGLILQLLLKFNDFLYFVEFICCQSELKHDY